MAISSGEAARPKGMVAHSSSQRAASPRLASARWRSSISIRAVATGPGLMPTTRRPSAALARPSARVKAMSAALPVLPAMYLGSNRSPAEPMTLTIAPRRAPMPA